MLYEKATYLDDFPINIRICTVESYPLHYHQDVEFVYVLKGEVFMRNSYCHYRLQAGDIFTSSGREVHGIEAVEENRDNVIAIIQISNRFFSQYFPEMPKACYFTYVRDDENMENKLDVLRRLLLRVLLNYAQKSFNYKYECTYMMIDVINYLNEHFNLFAFTPQGVVNFHCDSPVIAERASRIINYVYNRHPEKVSLDDLAEKENLSTYYISHLVKTYIGISFQDLLCFARSEMSEIPLLETNKKISAIAKDVGFSTTAYYDKFFRRWFGLSPQAHREKYQPLVLSPSCPARFRPLSGNDVISLLRLRLSAIEGQDASPSKAKRTVRHLRLSADSPAIRTIAHQLNAIVTIEDFHVMGDQLIPLLHQLMPAKITLTVLPQDAEEDIHQARQLLQTDFAAVQVTPQVGLSLHGAYGYDSIAGYIYVFNEYFLSGDALIPCHIRDQGNVNTVLQGCPACMTAGMIRKPSFYAYHLLTAVNGELLSWDKHHAVLRVPASDVSPESYMISVLNYSDEVSLLCQRDTTVHEVEQVLTSFVDEMDLQITLQLPPGKYTILRFSFTGENSIFGYMAQMGYPEAFPAPPLYQSMLCTQPSSYVQTEQINQAEGTLTTDFFLRGAAVQIAVILPV